MFNYYLPGQAKDRVAPGDQLDPAGLASAGLGGVLADVRLIPAHATVIDVKHGPDGQAGCVLAPVQKHHGTPDVIFNASYQTWERIRTNDSPQGGLWIGWKNGLAPTPEMFERWELLNGFPVADRKGQQWIVPIARAPQMEFGTLPQSYSFDPLTGEPVSHMEAEYLWLWQLSAQLRDWFRAAVGPPPEATPAERAAWQRPAPFHWLVKQAAKILGVNYRLGLAELNLLHRLGLSLLTQDSVRAICQSCYGWEIEDEAKKKPVGEPAPPALNSSPSTTGANTPAAAPGIGPVAAPSPPL